MSYDDEVLADAPLTYLKLDDTDPLAVTDLGSAAWSAWTYGAGALLGQDPVVADGGYAVAITDGTSNPAVIGDLPSTSLTELTVEFWFDAGEDPMFGVLASLIVNGAGGNAGVAHEGFIGDPVALGTPGRQFVQIDFNGVQYASPPLAAGPHHTASTLRADGSFAYYFDGVQVGADNLGDVAPYDLSSAVSGVQAAVGGYLFPGFNPPPSVRCDNFALYPKALSAQRIAAHYAVGTGGSGPAPAHELARARGATTATVVVPAARAAGRTRVLLPLGGHAAAHGQSRVVVHPQLTPQASTTMRATQGLVITMATPVIVDGLPTLPAHSARFAATLRATEGARHIHAIADPNPVWDPLKGGWGANPPVTAGRTTPWDGRWSVNDLPSPGGGYYWLGDPSSADGTAGITKNARLWRPDPSTPHAPAWRSAFPYKPSVTAHNHYLQGGGVVHHPKGVNFNSHFIEHMWTTFAHQFPQPYTWLVAGIVGSWPSPNYVHTILDTGVDPRSRGFHLGVNDVDTGRRINEGTNTRTYMRLAHHEIQLAAHTGDSGGPVTRARVNTHLRPCMFVGIFNNASSYTGVYAPGERRLTRGKVSGASPLHYLLGRQHGYLDQRRASHLVLFEIRFFRRALTRDDLAKQYDQMASSHQFHKYRRL